jgi:acetolactate decarboxylase
MRRLSLTLAVLLSLGLTGCCGLRRVCDRPAVAEGTLMQTSTIEALLTGVYEGPVTVGDLLRHGDFGLGTFDSLDGEMVVLEGIVYQVNAAGRVQAMAPETRTPFAAVTRFQPQVIVTATHGGDLAALIREIDRALPSLNYFYAVRVDGEFTAVRTRSVPRQTPPYVPLAEVVKDQAVFDLAEVRGTLVGLRCPAYSKGFNVPGYHFHFLTDDRQAGGHVLALTLRRGEVQVMPIRDVRLMLPADEGFATARLGEDRDAELHKVEK